MKSLWERLTLIEEKVVNLFLEPHRKNYGSPRVGKNAGWGCLGPIPRIVAPIFK